MGQPKQTGAKRPPPGWRLARAMRAYMGKCMISGLTAVNLPIFMFSSTTGVFNVSGQNLVKVSMRYTLKRAFGVAMRALQEAG